MCNWKPYGKFNMTYFEKFIFFIFWIFVNFSDKKYLNSLSLRSYVVLSVNSLQNRMNSNMTLVLQGVCMNLNIFVTYEFL